MGLTSISRGMVQFASSRIGEAHCLRPDELAGPADECGVQVVRFLNTQVISSQRANRIIIWLNRCEKEHTPWRLGIRISWFASHFLQAKADLKL